MIFHRSAYLDICTCRMHAWIVTSSGETLPHEIISQALGQLAVAAALGRNEISELEADIILSQLEVSGLRKGGDKMDVTFVLERIKQKIEENEEPFSRASHAHQNN